MGISEILTEQEQKELLEQVEAEHRNGKGLTEEDTINPLVSVLDDLNENTPPGKLESTLRALALKVKDVDPLRRATIREASIKKLDKIGVSAPAKLVDAAFQIEKDGTPSQQQGDKLNLLQHDLMLFALGAAAPVPVQSDTYLNDALNLLRTMIEKAIHRDCLTEIPRPYAPQLSWNNQNRRYQLDERKESEFFETRVAQRLGELIVSHGHLLKQCPAPEKMKRGRKPKNAGEQKPRGVCGKHFVAVKETQLYCSSQCLDRAVAQRKFTKTQKRRVKKRKPK